MDKSVENTLTPREYEVWTLADRGMSQRSIALALGISRSTVRSLLERSRQKLARKDAA